MRKKAKAYRKVFMDQILQLRISHDNVRFMVISEMNKNWAGYLRKWLDSDECRQSRLSGWQMFHDGHGVATMWDSRVDVWARPTSALVYDGPMLEEREAQNIKIDRLNWRKVSFGRFNVGPGYPDLFLMGVHVIAGSKKKRKAQPQKTQELVAFLDPRKWTSHNAR